MNELLIKISNYEDVFIFGYGNVGRNIFEQLIKDDISAKIWFCDNYRHAEKYRGVDILSPEDAFNKKPNALFIIGSIIYYRPMLDQLRALGVQENNIYTQWVQTKSRMEQRQYITHLPYHLTEHCNLKCAGCFHFSNVAKEQFADPDVFKETLTRFVDVMGNAFRGSLFLYGGEPLLHPLIEQFITYAHEIISDRVTYVITNGILLTKMPDRFWRTCAKSNVHIAISGYPIDLDKEKIRALADKHGVCFSIASRDMGAWSQYVLDLSGTQDIEKSFTNCENANECFVLKGRNLYPCSVTACIEHFNMAFDQSLELGCDDYLDLFTDITSDDVLSFVSKPVPFCRYCNRSELKRGQTWKRSELTIDEYLK